MDCAEEVGFSPEAVQGRPAVARRRDPLLPTIFHQPWWLAAASNGNYRELTVQQSGRKVGSLPYIALPMPGRQTICGMPAWTPCLGPAIDEGAGAACNRILRRAQVTRALLAQLPPGTGFRQMLHRDTTDTLVCQELGYDTSAQFTVEVPAAPRDRLWHDMRDETQKRIRQAEQQYRLRDLDDTAALRLTPGAIEVGRIFRAASEHGQGRLLAAETPAGKIAATMLYVWDDQSAYCIAALPDRGAAPASCLLLWNAMQDIASRGLTFDFQGLVTSDNAMALTGFGGRIVPRYLVSRLSHAQKFAANLSKIVSNGSGADSLRRVEGGGSPFKKPRQGFLF